MDWIIDFTDLMDKPITVTTREGTTAKGKLKDIEWREFTFNGQTLAFPVALLLDTDYRIGFGNIQSIDQER